MQYRSGRSERARQRTMRQIVIIMGIAQGKSNKLNVLSKKMRSLFGKTTGACDTQQA